MRIDAEVAEASADLSRRMLELQRQATELAGRTFNLDSPKQLQALLFDELKLPAVLKSPSGQPSTNEEALAAIADQHELPRVILDYRVLAKLRSTYTEKLAQSINPFTGRVHTSYHQAGAATGRLASSEPNLQNIPIRTEDGRRIRKAFVAPPGRKLVACDYSQIELRIMAHLSDDDGLLRAFESGVDIHKATAAEVFAASWRSDRQTSAASAKAINFGLMDGMSASVSRASSVAPAAKRRTTSRCTSALSRRARFQWSAPGSRRANRVSSRPCCGRRLYLDYIQRGTQAQRAAPSRGDQRAMQAPQPTSPSAQWGIDAWLAGQAGRR